MTHALEPVDRPGVLVAEPIVRTEIRIGHAWVSTSGQKLERQIDALTASGYRRIFADKKSAKNALQPELKACDAFLDPGDILVTPSPDRYRRSLQDLINVVAEFRERRPRLHLAAREPGHHHPRRPALFHVFAALAEFVRKLIVIGANEGPRPPPAPAPGSPGAPPSPPRKPSAPPTNCSPTPSTRSRASPRSSESPRASSTTTSRTSRNVEPAPYPAGSKQVRSSGRTRSGRGQEQRGSVQRLDHLRGRGRPVHDAAAPQDLGPRRPHTNSEGAGAGCVSMAGMACYKPGEHSRLICTIREYTERKDQPKGFGRRGFRDLLVRARVRLGDPIVLVWDNVRLHPAKPLREFIAAGADWFTVFRLPTYASGLNDRWRVVPGQAGLGQPHLRWTTPATPGNRVGAITSSDPVRSHASAHSDVVNAHQASKLKLKDGLEALLEAKHPYCGEPRPIGSGDPTLPPHTRNLDETQIGIKRSSTT
ncbi:recombinase family protein [Streptomyces sp. NPDC051644]|uniref:recombinase family protein n=1 Tax=Streptomyces sp. NPDC051644 TaxID=3365666 RepID=UPI00379365BD